jgi:hypothetical protein
MFQTDEFWYRTFARALPEAPDLTEERAFAGAVVVFFQAEAIDEARRGSVLTKLLKNVKWLAGKFATRQVLFHSFNHLGMSHASPQFAEALIAEAMERLRSAGYDTAATPFGYLNEWRMHVRGESLAKVYKEV